MARVVSFSLPDPDYELWLKFREIAQREGGISQVLRALILDYLQKHGSGNPAFSLDKWIDNSEFMAMPTLGEGPDPRRLRKMPRQALMQLLNNAKAYASTVEPMLRQLAEHEDTHKKWGLRDKNCIYCRDEVAP